jgi:predicted GIY-YIG superfamily endonuclease
MPEPQRTVYVLQSTTRQRRYYTGITSNLELRLRAHNKGLARHTASGRPWRVVVTVEFADPTAGGAIRDLLEVRLGQDIRGQTPPLTASPDWPCSGWRGAGRSRTTCFSAL